MALKIGVSLNSSDLSVIAGSSRTERKRKTRLFKPVTRFSWPMTLSFRPISNRSAPMNLRIRRSSAPRCHPVTLSLTQYQVRYSDRDETMGRAYLPTAFTLSHITAAFHVLSRTVSRVLSRAISAFNSAQLTENRDGQG